MLRIYCLQQWYNLSDPGAEDAIAHSGERERSFWRIVNTFTPLSIASFNF
jgi:hypothetical protein